MPRVIIIAVVIAVALTLYGIVDAAMTDARRARGLSKPVWVLITVLIPVIGAVLWLMIGKGPHEAAERITAPDDDPRFTGISDAEVDSRLHDLEARLKELDEEVYPGEIRAPDRPHSSRGSAGADADSAGTDPAGTDPAGTDSAGTDSAGTDLAGSDGFGTGGGGVPDPDVNAANPDDLDRPRA